MRKKIEKAIVVLFIAGALSGSVRAMEKASTLKALASTQSADNKGSSVLPLLLVAGSSAYIFRKEIAVGLKYCLIKSVLTVASVGKTIWDNTEIIPYRKLIPGF